MRSNPRRLIACCLAAAAMSPLASLGAPAQSASTADYPKVLRQMVDAGKMEVLKQFPTDKEGLTGYLVRNGGYQTVIYSEDGYLMLGPLYGPQGHNLSTRYADKYQAKPDVKAILGSLDADRFITQGPDDARTLYVFADPNCIFCHKLYQQTKPLVDAGKLQVKWIMVAVLGPNSLGRAVSILDAKDGAAALAHNEAHFDVANEQGGAPIGQPDAALAGVLDANRKAMFALGSSGTPTVIYRGQDGTLVSHQGVPPDGWLTHYANRPDQPHDAS